MTTSFAPSTPASVIAGARELAAGLHDVLWAARSPREMLDAVAELEKFKSELAAIEAGLVAEVDATKAAAEDQWGSAGDYLTAISGGFKGSGAATIRLAECGSKAAPPSRTPRSSKQRCSRSPHHNPRPPAPEPMGTPRSVTPVMTPA